MNSLEIKDKLPRNVLYGAIAVLALIEVVGGIRVVNLFNDMVNPDPEGFLPTHEEFFSARIQRLLWLLGMLLASVPLFFGFVIRGRIGNLLKNLLTSVYVVFIILLIAEGAFMYFPKSDAVGFRLSHDLWTRYYWESYFPNFDPRNAPMQLRGKEDYSWISNGKRKIFIVGDSFCAGDGVEENKMFSSILASKLPDRNIVNICERGSDIGRGMENLEVFLNRISPELPDVLIWQYYANDIEVFAGSNSIAPTYTELSVFQKFSSDNLQRKSYLTDYLYWEIFNPDRSEAYFSFLKKAYAHSKTISDHLAPLSEVISFFEQNKVPIIVVVFPLLHDIPKSEELYTRKLTSILQSKGVKVIDMSTHLEKIPVKERVVHNSNPHPSEKVHTIAAEKILEALLK